MIERSRLAVLFGGRSPEHEVSVVSARSILRETDAERFEIMPLGITRGRRLADPGGDAAAGSSAPRPTARTRSATRKAPGC